jgi:acyl transferase domain-containing protein/NADP-dependent 3-hydroxy acid dehydrogenase YdfG
MSSVGPQATPLAIVGIGCLFPKAPDARTYWLNVKHGVDAIGPVPATHWKPEDYLDVDPKTPDHTYAARGGFLDPIDFRPLDFGIAPNDLEAIDTSQLLGLVAAREALRDAGYGPDRTFDRNRVSVILGVTGTLELVIPLGARLGHPRWRKALKDAGIPDAKADEIIREIGDSYVGWQENSFPGLLGNVVAGRIANRLDLGGTNCVVDAACASSLSAIHLASLELATGRSDMVITGGIDAFNDIFMYMCFSKTPALSPTGDARPFDAAGDGTILGEGLGVVVLKRLADAQRDCDRIYAIVKGLGSSSDGKGNAIYAPSATGQAKALREAYRLAGVTPDTIELVEAHGTGTRVGDAVEVEALTQIYREARPAGKWCALGSVKSQIGHTKAAAGAAGLIKAALALHFKTLPSTSKVHEPIAALADSPFYVNSERRPWLAHPSHPRRAAISAFGFGGSNFHCVLEEAGPLKSEIDWNGEVEIAALSAKDNDVLLSDLVDWSKLVDWKEIQTAAALSRSRFAATDPVRLLLILQRGSVDLPKLIEAIGAKLHCEPSSRFWNLPNGVYYGAGKSLGKLAALFPGQGSQYPNMLRDLACLFPQMQATIANANDASPDRLSDRIYPPHAFSRGERDRQEQQLRCTDVAQPAIGAVSLGALRVIESFGVIPDACAGHSYGELPAMCAAGCFDEQELHSLSRLRGQLMASYQGDDAGSMVAVKAPHAIVESIIREESLDLVIANRNAPNQVVLSGRTTEIVRAITCLGKRQIPHSRLAVAAAFHSPLVATARAPFRETLNKVVFRYGSRPVYANTTGAAYPADATAMRDLLAGQLEAPVNFVDQIQRMADDGVWTFLEIGPGSALTKLTAAILVERPTTPDWDAFALDASSGKKPGTLGLAHGLARLAARGHRVDLTPWQRSGAPTIAAQPEAKGLVVPICGANYVNPNKKSIASADQSKRIPSPANPKPIVAARKPMIEMQPSFNGHHLPSAITAASEPAPAALAQALQVTQQSLAAFQKLQEQTAQLHKQFLESQEAAQRTLQMLVEQQHTLLSGGTVSSAASAPAVAATAKAGAELRHGTSPIAITQGANGSAHHQNGHHAPPRIVPPKPIPEPIRERARIVESAATAILMAVVAEKTGYPPDMLAPEMALDADLGIDSIKRVEIFSVLQEKLPNAPVVKPEHLGSLHTLGDVIAFLGARADEAPVYNQEPAAQARVSANSLAFAAGSEKSTGSHASEILLAVITEKTGYPVEMLMPEMALDADLGIDSIKRVEIFSALQERLPDAPVVKPEHLGSLHTLADVISFLNEPSGSATSQKKKNEPEQSDEPRAIIERSVLTAIPVANRSGDRIRLVAGSAIVVVGDSSPLCQSFCESIRQAGFSVVARSWADQVVIADSEEFSGLVLVAPAQETHADLPVPALRWMKALQPKFLANAFFATLTRLDGAFGLLRISPSTNPETGALAGLLKTAKHEWPAIHCKAIDVGSDVPATKAAEIWEEILSRGPIEVGLTESGRIELALQARTCASVEKPLLDRSDVVLITGGARGVTAAAARVIAERCQSTIVLLGRTDIEQPEPESLCDCVTEAEIKRALSQLLENVSPRTIDAQFQRIVANREVHATLESLRHIGARVIYFSADVTDAEAVRKAIQEIRTTVGAVTCLIHGAGILADRRITDLTEDAFASVYATKVVGLKNLLCELDDSSLKALALFSSSTGRFGRTGQAAYAAANEALNKIAQQLAALRPDCKVVSINWGPWDGGMVTPALRKLFADEGVGVIPLQEGGEILVSELATPKSDVEVVVIARPAVPAVSAAALARVFERDVSVHSHPVLQSHVIGGRAVLPLALQLEWLAHAALHGNPGLAFHGLNDLRVLHGVQIHGDESIRLRLLAGKPRKEGALFLVPVELRSRRKDRDITHSRAEIILATRLPAAMDTIESLQLPDATFDSKLAYDQYLFHGSDLQGIERIVGVGKDGIEVDCRNAPPPSAWLTQPLRSTWIADPLILDSAFQAMIVWSAVNRDAGCLPSFVGTYRQYGRTFPAGNIRICARIAQQSGAIVRADIDFLNQDGERIARIENHESVIDDSLNHAFRNNCLEQDALLTGGGVR